VETRPVDVDVDVVPSAGGDELDELDVLDVLDAAARRGRSRSGLATRRVPDRAPRPPTTPISIPARR